MKQKTKWEQACMRRMALKTLCNKLKTLVNSGQMLPSPDGTMNGLLRSYYAQAGHKELHTFREWKEKGFTVKKGEKAILLWAHPKASKASREAAREAGKQDKEAEEDYFPIAYLFSSRQVIKKCAQA